ncbi:MAG: methyltransferase domain-containing protein [Gammaproteobacteria bacterium]
MSTYEIVRATVRRLVKKARNYGGQYACPFCNSQVQRFGLGGFDFPVLYEKQVIGGGRRAMVCPICWSSDRERLIYLYLRDRLGLFDAALPRHVLHIAPERRLFDRIRTQPHVKYICGDKFMPGYKYDPSVIDVDITRLQFPENSFDLVICNHVLEHVPDDAAGMRELNRVLKPGGAAILQVPISANSAETFEDAAVASPDERERVYGQNDHLRLYGQDYGERLARAGFTVARERIGGPEVYGRYGIDPREDLYVVQK